jgi:hypothetical protein
MGLIHKGRCDQFRQRSAPNFRPVCLDGVRRQRWAHHLLCQSGAVGFGGLKRLDVQLELASQLVV